MAQQSPRIGEPDFMAQQSQISRSEHPFAHCVGRAIVRELFLNLCSMSDEHRTLKEFKTKIATVKELRDHISAMRQALSGLPKKGESANAKAD
jgi:hypothetical protein